MQGFFVAFSPVLSSSRNTRRRSIRSAHFWLRAAPPWSAAPFRLPPQGPEARTRWRCRTNPLPRDRGWSSSSEPRISSSPPPLTRPATRTGLPTASKHSGIMWAVTQPRTVTNAKLRLVDGGHAGRSRNLALQLRHAGGKRGLELVPTLPLATKGLQGTSLLQRLRPLLAALKGQQHPPR